VKRISYEVSAFGFRVRILARAHMDSISHILIGKLLASSPKYSKKAVFITAFFSFLPDLSSIPMYLYLGYIKARPFWIPYNSDWNGVRELRPVWSALWDIPHSLFFAVLIILPIILFFKLPKIAFFAYIFHIFIDIFTHTGEWAVKLFYPLSYKIEGFTNAWTWPLWTMAISWLILIVLIISLKYIIKKT